MTLPEFPRITLVTPVYNGADLLARNVESVAGTRYPNLEHILVDNRSTDRSWEVMNELAARRSHLRVTRQDEIQGAAASINHGFSLATGDIFAWLGHDDQWLPETPWRVQHHWQKQPDTDFLAGAVRILSPDGGIERDRHPAPQLDFLDLFFSSHIVNQEGCFWRREVHLSLDPNIRGAFDYDLWLRMFSREPFRAAHTDELLAYFQRRAGQLSGNTKTYTDEMNGCRALYCSRRWHRPSEDFMTFSSQFAASWQEPDLRRHYEQRIARDGAIFSPRLNENLVGIFFFLARAGSELVFHIHEAKTRSIALLQENQHCAVAKVRAPQLRLSIRVPESGLVGVDLTSRGLDDPNECWIKCSHITCDGRTILRAPKAPRPSTSAPEIRLAYPV